MDATEHSAMLERVMAARDSAEIERAIRSFWWLDLVGHAASNSG
jgi:hypothetical protein